MTGKGQSRQFCHNKPRSVPRVEDRRVPNGVFLLSFSLQFEPFGGLQINLSEL